ncbi:hypothetical protein EK21DRAFT_89824 [Setomelanomma holmii]|uniref:FAD-binding PCMH-type domain-containing protein n=1 Tax=Setomelanomma holmii TaxID=210430 RepID=A0A9P4LMZ6_9PLEO|nr:hypothetical protein EK21DRAFT_89824 [Setomelanomma holmii]
MDILLMARATAVCKIAQLILPDQVITSANPHSALEVAIVMKIITSVGAKFAVRSGGHFTSPDFASIRDEGVLLDIRDLSQIRLSDDHSVSHTRPVISGGMSHFTNAWGMVANNVKNFEVVLADSRIGNANQDDHADLFKALKGGGPNFGIVTRFDLYTKSDYKLRYTTRVYSTDDAHAVMAAAVKVQENITKDDNTGFFLSTTPTILVTGMLYKEWVDARPNAFAPFDDITPVSVPIPETNGTQYSSAVAQTMNQVGKRASGTMSLKPDVELYVKTLGILQDVVRTSPNISLVHTFQPLGPVSVEKSKSFGGNVLNVQPVSQPWVSIVAFWTDDALDATGLNMIQRPVGRIKAAAAEARKMFEFEFVNDSDFAQSPLCSYGIESIGFMKESAEKYDPGGVFKQLQNDGLLVSKVRNDT